MKRVMKALLVVTLAVILSSQAIAQFPVENHYKTYFVNPTYTYFGDIMLVDQFGDYFVTDLILDRFANPVEKNGEPIIFPWVHQTWWSLDLQGEGWIVEVENQFGIQVWQVTHPRYLVLPAWKNEPGPPLDHNHYLAYEAFGEPLFWTVNLVDQWGVTDVVVLEPVFFLNPVEKIVNGIPYPIFDDQSHLACYRIDPPLVWDVPLVAYDQFGIWQTVATEQCLLCVPSHKRTVVQTEKTTWGEIKTLYHD